MALNNKKKKIDPSWAWARYEPDAQRPWDLKLAGHLFRRAGFGANWDLLQEALVDGPGKTIDNLLDPKNDTDEFNKTYNDYEISAAGGGESTEALSAWWLRRMIQTPHPLLEKMTLFWHDYFGISNAKVKNSRLMQKHTGLLRKEALGSFRSMLKAIPYDPAVLLCINSVANRKAMPDEKLARVLLAEYTVGEGNFTDKDVSEAARAFTGWFVLRSKLKYIEREHDETTKAILGKKGNFGADDVIEVLLGREDTSKRIVRKLFGYLISETHEPNDEIIGPLAESFGKDYDILKLVEKMLRSNLFFSSIAYRQRVKSPIEFAVGISKGLETTISTTQLAQDMVKLGHNLYNPPTIKGFPQGAYWVSDTAMTGRYNLAVAMLKGEGPYKDKLDPWQVARKYNYATVEEAGKFILDLFLQGDINEGIGKALLEKARIGDDSEDAGLVLRRFTQSVVTGGEFNLA